MVNNLSARGVERTATQLATINPADFGLTSCTMSSARKETVKVAQVHRGEVLIDLDGADDELHAEELPALVGADFVDGHDVRVVEMGGGLGFSLEPGYLGGRAIEPDLSRLENHAHAAAGDFLAQFVVAKAA